MKTYDEHFEGMDDVDVRDDDIAMNEQFEATETALKLKTDLLQKDQFKKVQTRLIDDSKEVILKLANYELACSNGIFEAIPGVVKFSGFELNKQQRIKLQIVNRSKFSQRCSIIPPSTPYFNIKFTKKGNIAPGLSETIIITFNPQGYQ
jgi:hypothetical protein